MKIFNRLFLIVILSGFLVTKVNATEGVVQMEAQDNTEGRCFVVSTLLADFQYKMLANCRGLRYPIAQNLFQYVMWADHGDNKPTRLGTLGVGKREFIAPKPFSRLLVTKESGSEPTEPSTNMFMSGGVAPIAFLEGVGVDVALPTPTMDPDGEIVLTDDPTVQTSGVGAGTVIRVLGIAVVLVVVLIIIIAFVSASRRRPMDI